MPLLNSLLMMTTQDEQVCEPLETSFQSDASGVCSISSLSLLVKKFSMRHGLTQEAIADLLLIIRHYLSDCSLLPGSVYLFEKQFQSLKFPVKYHYMCGFCSETLPSNEVD